MNSTRRKALQRIIDKLGEVMSALEDVQAEEEEYRDNMPENLQGSERYEKAETACNRLSDAVSDLEEAISDIEEAME